MRRPRVYIAGPLFTRPQQDVINYIHYGLNYRNLENFSPYHSSQDIFNGRKPADCTADERARVVEDNISNLDWCDIVLAWVGGMGGFTDPGTIWEMGYANKGGKFILAYIDDTDERTSMNLMLAATINGFVRGREELKLAMEYMRGDVMPALQALRTYFSPEMDADVAADREPVV